MPVCLLFAGLYGVAKGATGRLKGNKSDAQALSQGIILFALMVCFFVFGGLDVFFRVIAYGTLIGRRGSL